MRKFKNKKTGVIEIVRNDSLVEQYTKRTDIWQEIKNKGEKPNSTENTENK